MDEPSELTIELGEGFADDEVVVLADGQEVWHESGVTTNYSVGLADVLRLRTAAPGTEVELLVRRKGRSYRTGVRAGAHPARLRATVDDKGNPILGPAPEGPVF
jgi:hypothetical protein